MRSGRGPGAQFPVEKVDHWAIENGLPCVRDPTFGEDASKLRSVSARHHGQGYHQPAGLRLGY